MGVVTAIVIGMLAAAGVICVVRALRPSTIVDRAIALDGVVSAIICGFAVGVVRTGSGLAADLSLAGGLVGFLTLCTIARYVGRRGS